MKPPPLRLDFAASRSGATPLGLWLAATGSAMLAVVATLWAMSLQQRNDLAEALAKSEQHHVRSATSAAPSSVAPGQLARERLVRETTRGLTTPWADLLSALEAAPTESVALLLIEPSVAKRSVRLTAEGRDARAMLAYLAALQRDVRLAQVVLVSHQVQLQTPGTPVRFQIQALWADAP